MEAEVDDLLLLLPWHQVCGPDLLRSRIDIADMLKCCRCWHCENILVGGAWVSRRYLLDWRQSPHLVHRRNAARDRLRLRTLDPTTMHICSRTFAQPQSPIQTAQRQRAIAHQTTRRLHHDGECEERSDDTYLILPGSGAKDLLDIAWDVAKAMR